MILERFFRGITPQVYALMHKNPNSICLEKACHEVYFSLAKLYKMRGGETSNGYCLVANGKILKTGVIDETFDIIGGTILYLTRMPSIDLMYKLIVRNVDEVHYLEDNIDVFKEDFEYCVQGLRIKVFKHETLIN